MKPEVAELFAAALEREPSERDAFLDDACAGDVALRGDLASLLAAHARTGPVDRLADDLAPLAARLQDPDPPGPLAGRMVGPYRLGARLGGGGMGLVYEAVDTRVDRPVALKFLHRPLQANRKAAERFRLEARSVALLEHPNICALHEIGETGDGQLFLAMPRYDGETLQARITRGPLQPEDAVGIAAQIAGALGAVHARGIVHRDIKPSNVLVTGDGIVKLLDFGIAKLAGISLTSGAAAVGTAAYMSPEQAAGGEVDHRTDLWSLGVVLYEMLAGRRPFRASNAAMLHTILSSEPPPASAHRAGVSPALDRVVARALARAPEARYATAAAFEHDLLTLELR